MNAAARDDTGRAWCPWCGEAVTLVLDPGGASVQRYVEDCPVCCRPWEVEVRWGPGGGAAVTLEPSGG